MNLITYLYRKIILCIILILCPCLYAVDINSIRFTQCDVNRVLPSHTIYAVEQDKNGEVWVGTNSGVSRYDGYNVESYFERNNQISNDVVFIIYLDSKNRLWILTDNGVNKYSYENNDFDIYLKDDNYNCCAKGIAEFDNKLLVGTNRGLFYYDESENSFVNYNPEVIDKKLGVVNLFAESESVLWFSSFTEVYRYDKSKNVIENKTSQLTSKLNIKGMFLNQTALDNRKRLWLSINSENVIVWDYNNDNITLLKNDKGDYIKEFKTLECIENNIWIGADEGIHIFNNDLKLERHIIRDIFDDTNISDNSIYRIYKDKSGNIWVGTYFGGLNQYLNFSDNFKTYSFGYTNNHLSGKAVRQILEDEKERLWIATEDGGLNIVDNGKIEKPDLNINGKHVNNIHTLLRDSENNIWIGSYGEGIFFYSNKTGKISYTNFPERRIFNLKQDKNNNIWAATTAGLFVKEHNSKSFNRVDAWTERLGWIFSYSLLPVDDCLWVGTFSDGIHLMDNKAKSCHKIDSGDDEVRSVYFLELIDDKIWSATNNGVFVFSKSGDFIKRYSIDNGLSSNEAKAIVEDVNGVVWITTNVGICSVNPKSDEIDNYTEKDGLPVNQFNFSSAYRSLKDNRLYFGSFNGMISFNPDSIVGTNRKFPIHITNFNANGRVIREDFSEVKNIKLSYNEARSIFIEFSGLNFKYLNNSLYKFSLDAGNNEWVELGNSHQVQLYNLKPGEHKLIIVGGTENEWDYDNAFNFAINIEPPFWFSLPAYIIYLLIVLLVLYFVYKYIRFRISVLTALKAEKQNLKNVEEMNRKRTNFFTYISHDLRTPLSLIISPLHQLSQNYELDNDSNRKITIALNNARKINNLIDQLLLFSKFEDNKAKISISCEDITQTLFDIVSGFEILSKEKGVEFVSEINITDKNVWYSSTAIERILYNLLSNAFKFTETGDKVVFKAIQNDVADEKFIKFEISDTGCGMSDDFKETIFENYYQLNPRDEKSGYGLGLPLVRSLVILHKGEIEVESKKGVGTSFMITVNVTESAFTDEEHYMKQNIDIHDNYLFLEDCNIVKTNNEISENEMSEYKILIVEDNVELNNYLKEILSVNYSVDVAFDGYEGYEKAEKGNYDLILSDVMMPRMNGNEFVNKLKNNVETSHILVILLSAKIEPVAKSEGFENGADAYLSKPFNPNDLLRMIANLLQTKNSIICKYKVTDDTPVIKLGTNKKDEEFLNKIESLIMENIKHESFGIDNICLEMGVSRSLLYLKLKKLTDSSATEFIRTIKMKEAKKQMLNGLNVSEASYSVGIYDPNYFTKCFKKQFGKSPSEYIKEISV